MIQTQKRKRSPWRMIVPVVLVIALLVAGAVYLSHVFSQRVSKPIALTARSTQHVTAFGNDVLYYDGMMLHAVNTSGGHKWSFQLGQYAGYHTFDKHIVAWSANQLYILDGRNGSPLYNDRMGAEIQFARVGNDYVAAFVGELSSGNIHVMDLNGKSVDSMQVDSQTLLDIGFFAEGPEMMWVLGLDTSGTVPSLMMQTYRPGTLATGNATLGEQLVYKVYYYNKLLRIADTRQIRTFDYKIKQDVNTPPILIYGWLLTDTRQVGREMAQLLVPAPQMDGTLHATDLRVLMNTRDRVLHLPTECFGAALGNKSVYGFSANYVYVCKYDENTFKAYALPIFATRVLGITENNRAILAAGSDVYLVQLPE